jgi:LmbE family N-acetylglucosaminyl deacetylase
MWEELKLSPEDVIAVIAPHPDDECLGAASVLLTAPERTDVYVLTDGSHGSKERTIEEEAAIRKAQFDAEMACVKPRSVHWLGYEDTTLPKHYEAADSIDFTQYTKVFLPWQESVHPDHRAACVMCCRAIMKQNASPECYIYEITAPFKWPTHFADITQLIDEKCRLIDCHKDQIGQKEITVTLNALRAAILIRLPAVHYAECYMKVDPYEIGYCNDILVRLNSFKEDYGLYDRLLEQGIRIKRVMSCDIGPVQDFIRNNFAGGWADEVLPAILNGSCFIAVRGREIVAFGCADATAKGYVGPAGTLEEVRRMGISRAIFQRCFRYLIEQGYKYAIVGMPADPIKNMMVKMADANPIERSRCAYDDLLVRVKY